METIKIKNMKITEQLITPDMAKKYLEKTKLNRRLGRAIILYKAGRYSSVSGSNRNVATNKSILEFIQKNEELQEIVTFVMNQVYYHFRFIPVSTLGMVYFILSKKNATKCDEFFNKLAQGIDLAESNPIRHLREKLMKDSLNKSKLNQRDKAALLIYTWNNFVQGKRISQLLLPKNYTFPKPI